MKKVSLLLLFFIYSSIAHCGPDSILVERRVKAIIAPLSKTNDSLQRELQYYKIKEDYYSVALSDQSTRFAAIVGAIVGLVALIGFGWYINLKKQIEDSRLYIDQVTDNIIAQADESLKSLKEASESRDIDRLEGIGSFYFSHKNAHSLNINNDPILSPIKPIADKLFSFGLELLYLEVGIELYESTEKFPDHSINKMYTKKNILTIIGMSQAIVDDLNKLYKDIPKEPTVKTDGISRQGVFSSFGINLDSIDRTIQKNKKKDLLNELYKLRLSTEELLLTKI